MASKWIRNLVLVVVAAMLAGAAQARPAVDPHHVDGSSLGGVINLTSTWLAQQGDDLRWADPKFDDSRWTVVEANKKFASYGMKDVDAVWYRVHVQIPPGRRDLSLQVRFFNGSYTVYVNGAEVGTSGPHPDGGILNGGLDQRFSIPASLVGPSGDLTIAVRANVGRSSARGTEFGGFTAATLFLLGTGQILSDASLLYRFRSYASNTTNILMELMVVLIALALALTLPKEREYIALVFSSAAAVCVDFYAVWQRLSNVPDSGILMLLMGCVQALQVIALLEFVRLVLGLPRTKLLAAYEWIVGGMLAIAIPYVQYALSLGSMSPTASLILILNAIVQIGMLPVSTGLPLLALWVWWRQRKADALLLFVPLFLQAVIVYCQFGILVLNRLHLSERNSLPAVPTSIFFVQWSEVAQFLFSVALLLFLVLRTVRIARSRAAMATDLHAVQSVQEFLLARASQPTPGFRVEHVYYPAQEVGGDFFLVSPGPDGSLTAIVGDVSGKGLVAAMRVSMILGVLRREEEREPGMVLKALNEALLMQTDMGFTTACCVHLDHDGSYAIANAGHISPYIDGEEIVTAPSLPLGIAPGEEYEQISGYLPAGKTIVLMSDGVVEARSSKGELYGFDRLPKLTMMSAEDIADVARRFGQEDDITVLTVACGA